MAVVAVAEVRAREVTVTGQVVTVPAQVAVTLEAPTPTPPVEPGGQPPEAPPCWARAIVVARRSGRISERESGRRRSRPTIVVITIEEV